MGKMPKSPNIIQFSLPTEVRERLEAMGSGESVALVAKRVLLEALGDNPSVIAAPSSDALAELSDRLDTLEESQGHLNPDDLERLGKIISDQLGLKEIRDRLSDLSTRLHQMELFLSDRPLPPTLPKKEMTQGLTHKEMAEKIGSSERTMHRVAKERERWPEGYHWSEESKKWFPS